MGQYWYFYNVSKRERMKANGLSKLGCIFFPKQARLVRSLAIPYPLPELAKYLESSPPPGPIAKKGLLSLPDEILASILERPDLSFEDTICLAVTCKKLLSLAERCILWSERAYCSASWARCRIGCIGDYATYEDAPDALISPAMKTEIRNKLAQCDEHERDVSYAGLELLQPKQHQEPYMGAEDLLCVGEYLARFTPSDVRLFAVASAVTFPHRDDWVLCNTVKQEYVRAGALAALGGVPDDEQPFLPKSPIDLGTALMARFCWSSSADVAMHNVTSIHRGKWAGDRFCVTTIEREINGKTGWTDVTDEVIADIVAIYKAEFPSDWEKQLQKYQGPFDYSLFRWDTDHTIERVVNIAEWYRNPSAIFKRSRLSK